MTKLIAHKEKIKFTLFIYLVLTLNACGDKTDSQKNSSPSPISNDTRELQQGPSSPVSSNSAPMNPNGINLSDSLSIRIVDLKDYRDEDRCEVYLETKNSGEKTISMLTHTIFKTKNGQVIESASMVIKTRGGQTTTQFIPAHEKCNIVGTLTITDARVCEVDGMAADDEVCWTALNPTIGVLPLIK